MNQLTVKDDCRSATDVFAKAKIVYEKRRAMFRTIAQTVSIPLAEAEDLVEAEDREPERFFMCPVAIEIARQLGIDASRLKGSKSGRKAPIIQYRQLAMALALRTARKSLPQVGMVYGAHHTTVLHAQIRMAPIIAAVELTLDNSLQEWVAACLPLLFAYLEQMRLRSRGYANPRFFKGAGGTPGERRAGEAA